ncbi:MAG: MBL fold metallo-hydrolase [Cyclobacteriaceae bacterium]|nr:MBL fold metallo-hydrolase [Cyclobacteriaceae bacterium]
MLRKILKGIAILVILLSVSIILFMQQKSFGKLPRGERQQRIEQSPNYRNGSFQNLTETHMLAEGTSYFSMLREFLKTKPDQYPLAAVPVIKTDLHTFQSENPALIWFGHSSYLLLISGKRILIDPVFSDRPSPVQYLGSKSFNGARVYGPDDFPQLDLILITHDHYDHLDYNSIAALKSKAAKFVVPLGVGEHLEYWGVPEDNITELDWWDSLTAFADVQITATPARHFSGRGFTRNKTLWTSYVLKAGAHNLFIGGDSGYDPAFKTIGEKFGPFDLALLECGQYDRQWPSIHMMPEQTVQASVDLKAEVLMPVHWGKFVLANHAWKDPIDRATVKAKELNVITTTPRIGEPVILGKELPKMEWWKPVQ